MHRFDPDRYYRTTDPELAVLATQRHTESQWRHRGEGTAVHPLRKSRTLRGPCVERVA